MVGRTTQEEPLATEIRRVDYFYTTVRDQPGEAYKVLSALTGLGIELLAFVAIPLGSGSTQLTLFPEDDLSFLEVGRKAGLALEGPHPALLVQGDSDLAALAGIHEKLFAANVNVYAATGVASGRSGFGYLIYVKPDDYERAATAVEI